jgi:hypothetical protein
VRLNTAGGTLLSRAFGDAAPDVVEDIAVGSDGSLAITGHYAGTLDFGTTAFDSKGGFDVFIARIGVNGSVVQAMTLGGLGAQLGGGIAFDGNDIVVAGSFTGVLDGINVSLTSNGGFDVFLVKLRDGLTLDWAQSYGGSQDDYSHALSADPSGGVVLTGGFQGSMALGPPTLISLGGFDVFVAKIDTDGGVLFSRAYGDTQEDTVRDVDVSDFGTVILTGEFRGSINFGQGQIVSQGAEDVFVAALTP